MKKSWTWWVDHAIFMIIIVLASLPFARVPIGPALVVNLQAILYIFLTGVILLRIFIVGQTRCSVPFLLFFFTVGISILNVLMFTDTVVLKVLNHLVSYSPYILACLILWAGTTISPRDILIAYTVAAAFGALVAAYFFFMNPAILILTFGDSPETTRLLSWGRLPWLNAYLTFFIVLQITYIHPRNFALAILLRGCALIALIGMVATFSRTLIASVTALLGIITFRLILLHRFRTLSRLILLSGVLIAVTFGMASLDQRVTALYENRLLGIKDLSAVSLNDVESRTYLYDQYWQRLEEHWLIGQGLGTDYTDVENTAWADVTLVSFLLPFGVLGIMCLGYTLYTFWVLLDCRGGKGSHGLAWAMRAILVVSFLTGINDDIWSHKSFVLYLAFIITAISSRNRIKQSSILYPPFLGISASPST